MCPTSIVSYVNVVVPKLEHGATWRPSRAIEGGDVIHGKNYISGAMTEKFGTCCFKFCLHRKGRRSELKNVFCKAAKRGEVLTHISFSSFFCTFNLLTATVSTD